MTGCVITALPIVNSLTRTATAYAITMRRVLLAEMAADGDFVKAAGEDAAEDNMVLWEETAWLYLFPPFFAVFLTVFAKGFFARMAFYATI